MSLRGAIIVCAALLGGALGLIAQPAPSRAFSVEGTWVEACTCKSTCAGEVTGEPTGCDAMGACRIDKGTIDGKDLSGLRLAIALDHGDNVHLYLDAPEPRRAALESFARAALAAWGTVKSVAPAKVEISGKDGSYTVKVNDGKLLSLMTEPVLGGDHKTPVAINNTLSTLNPTLYQGKCISGTYADGEHKITIEKGRNSFFNAAMKQSGTL